MLYIINYPGRKDYICGYQDILCILLDLAVWAQRISDLEREIKQREQSREYSSIKERLEAGRQSIADREREVAKRKRHDRGMSR